MANEQNNVELTPVQLAALDLIIAQAKEDPTTLQGAFFITAITRTIVKTVQYATRITPTLDMLGAKGVAGNTPQAADVAGELEKLDNVTLDQLIALRSRSTSK